MGIIYSNCAYVAIVYEHGENGLTKEEILKINAESYKAPMEANWDYIDLFVSGFVEKREGQFFLKPELDIDILASEIELAKQIMHRDSS